MDTFTFNNIVSSSYDIIIKKMPPITSPLRNIETIKIDGRNGNLHIDNGTYDVKNITIECVVTTNDHINDIKGWLTGIGTISFSTEPNVVYDCVVKNQIALDKYLTHLREFPLQLELFPIGKSTTLTTVTKTTSPATFTVGGTIGAKPILEVKGTGEATITLNGTAFTLSTCDTTAYIVDCDLQNVTKASVQKNSEFVGTFPSLIIGTNNLSWTGTVSEIKIKYYESYL